MVDQDEQRQAITSIVAGGIVALAGSLAWRAIDPLTTVPRALPSEGHLRWSHCCEVSWDLALGRFAATSLVAAVVALVVAIVLKPDPIVAALTFLGVAALRTGTWALTSLHLLPDDLHPRYLVLLAIWLVLPWCGLLGGRVATGWRPGVAREGGSIVGA